MTAKICRQKNARTVFFDDRSGGGNVNPPQNSSSSSQCPSAWERNDTKFMQKFGNAVAVVLKGLGFNVNLAPVLDISAPTKDSFIGSRTFGNDPVLVRRLVRTPRASMRAGSCRQLNIFPATVAFRRYSHHTTPKKLATYERLADRDLVPFEDFAQAEFPRAVMMAHIALPTLTQGALYRFKNFDSRLSARKTWIDGVRSLPMI